MACPSAGATLQAVSGWGAPGLACARAGEEAANHVTEGHFLHEKLLTPKSFPLGKCIKYS